MCWALKGIWAVAVIISILILASASFTSDAFAQTIIQLNPTEDNYVVCGLNCATEQFTTPDPVATIFTYGLTGCQNTPYFLKFDVSSFPTFPGEGTLRLHASAEGANTYNPNFVNFRAIQVSNSWSDSTITFAAQPPEIGTAVIVSNPGITLSAPYDILIPLTNITPDANGKFSIKVSDTLSLTCDDWNILNTVDHPDVNTRPYFEFDSGTSPPPPAPGPTGDFEIVSVEPVQAVFDSDALIEGKDTVISVLVKNTFDEDLKVFLKVTATGISDMTEELDMPRNCEKRFYFPIPINTGLCDNNERHTGAPLIPSKGDFSVSAFIDFPGQIPETDEENNSDELTLPVKETRKLIIPFTRFVDCHGIPGFGPPCYGSVNDALFNFGKDEGGFFTSSMFPIKEQNFVGEDSGFQITGNPLPCGFNLGGDPEPDVCIGITQDLISVTIASSRSDPNAEGGVGLVPNDYFVYHNLPNALGIKKPAIDGVISLANNPITVPHELAHSYGIDHSSITPDGYFVQINTPVPSNAQNLMCDEGPCENLGPPAKWIDKFVFESLFNKFKTDPNDPEILFVSGIVTSDGEVTLREWFELPNGTSSDLTPGEFSINLMDESSQVIAEFPFDMQFGFFTQGAGFIETKDAGFAFKIPYPPETLIIEIKQNDQILVEVMPNSKTLVDSISGIPDECFKKKPDQRRKALLNKVSAFEKKLEEHEFDDAIEKLQEDIRSKIKKWLINECTVENPLQFTPSEVLELIDNTVLRIQNMIPP